MIESPYFLAVIASSYNPNKNVISLLAYCFELKGRTEIHRGVLYAVFIALKEYVPFISLLVLLKKNCYQEKGFVIIQSKILIKMMERNRTATLN